MTGETMMQQAQLPQEQQQQQQQQQQLQQKQLTELEQPEQLPQETQQTQQQQQPDNQSSDQDMAEQESNDQEDMVQAESDDQEDMDQETQAHVQQQRQRELGKLHAIDAKVRQVHERLTSRLPRQRAHLAAKVCGAVWAVRASRRHDTSNNRTDNNTTSLAKKLRLELGAFDYQVREQGELLTRHLCDLDDVLSFGDAAIKDARKALVVFIQSEALPLADALREQSAKLRAFGERLISTLPVESSEADVQAEAQATRSNSSTKMPSPSSTAGDAVDSDVDVDMHPLFGTDDESADEVDNDDGDDVSDEGEGEDEDMSEADDDKDEDEDRQQEEEEDDDDESIEERAPVSAPTVTSPGVDTRSLPVWKPYYQIHKRRDALYLVANLRDVDPQNVRVQWLERAGGSGVLHISGVKLPTQRDVMVSRFSGVPTFGRFEIAERVPANAVDMSRASQTLREDGTLEVRMPYVSVTSSSSSSSSGYNYPRRYSVAGYPYSSDSDSYPSDYYRHQQQIHHPLHPLQQYYQQQQGYPHSAFRRRVSPWFDAPRCAVW